jgi:hypothetical protein
LQRISKQGPSMCSLCKMDEEIITHLLMKCTYVRVVWDKVENRARDRDAWKEDLVENYLKPWFKIKELKFVKDIPLVVCYGTYLA